MKITKLNPFTCQPETHDLPVTPEQLKAYEEGGKAVDIFTNLSDAQMEYMRFGIPPGS